MGTTGEIQSSVDENKVKQAERYYSIQIPESNLNQSILSEHYKKMPPRAMDNGAAAPPAAATSHSTIKRVGSMGNISVGSDEKPSNMYYCRKSTLIGYVLH